jgi:hypothetical protein
MKFQRKEKERPILMSAPMVRATLDGSKTQTRRIVKPRCIPVVEECFRVNGKWCNHTFDYDLVELCPYGVPSDRLWVKETYSQPGGTIHFRADDIDHSEVFKWRPSIFMFRHLSRILLKIEEVRVERLQDISADDCMAEGIPAAEAQLGSDASWRLAYQRLWESINGPGSWKKNPWVWAITFKRIEFPRIDALPK